MPSKVLQVKGLAYRDIIKNVTFDLHQGEIVALMGENGSGKSTLAKLLTGLLQSGSGTVQLFENGTLYSWETHPRWQEIAFVGQHPRRQTIGASVAEELGFGLLNQGFKVRDVRTKVKELASLVGLEGKENQSPSTLSGGERQRLVTAALLALKPAFLILDEALTMLDQKAQDKILALLLKEKANIGQLWVTHDPELARLADRLLLIKNGFLIEAGGPEVLEDQELRSNYGIRLSLNKNNLERKKKKESTKAAKQPVLEWEAAVYGTRLSLDKVIKVGEFIAIMGPSGAGKSTLLESVIGLNLPSEGVFKTFGEILTQSNLAQVRKRNRLVLQEPGEYFIGHTVYDEVFYGQKNKKNQKIKEANLSFLFKHGIQPDQVYRAPECLSGGERQRVALAAALQTRPEILLLDEPMLGLDGPGRELIKKSLNDMLGRLTILYVTHDIEEVLEYADRLWLVENGQVTLDCPAESWNDYRHCWLEAGVRIS
ncbi:MAG: ATP-binding cassette domain-containing protein [Desulfitobacteriaceae bacterium]|nr:ATP-binding cassette domain-containing protein [Desulfitobacteriaceae bacterium]MDD4346014.1 ATP-binding cassette domain-containing protein [Desulfitobacteriaceae bacterium]MDD4401400.1 ATP-binding cassette domain-containing protein [Desulfitobacteriaceae bacterium]